MNQPRFRSDLVTRPVEENGARFVDVTDPDSGKTFRFYEVEYAVAAAMDGQRNVTGLIDWARAELGLEPSKAEVETVISTLDALGYLGGGDRASTDVERNAGDLDVSDLSLGAPGRSPIRADEHKRREAQNIDLGGAGRSPMSGARRDSQAPKLELGAAGGNDDDEPLTGAPPPPAPIEMPEAPLGFGLGETDPKRTLMGTGPLTGAGIGMGAAPTHQSQQGPPPGQHPGQRPADLSIDLGQHINIGTDDVKEAVRASRVMSVPDMPDMTPAPRRGPPPGATPIELPQRAPAHSVPPPHYQQPPPLLAAPSRGPSVLTLVLFVGLLLAAAATAYYFLVYAKDDGSSKSPAAKPTTTAEVPTNAPKGPIGMISEAAPTLHAVNSPRAGAIAWLVAADAEVAEGEVVVKFEGFKDYETKMGEALESKKRYQTKLDKATSDGNKAAMQDAESQVARKQADIEGSKKALDEFMVTAPAAGKVALKTELGAKVEADAPLVEISSESWPIAEFAIADATKYKVGAKLEVMVKNTPSKTAMCEVTEVTASQLLLKCPPDAALGDKAALTLR